MPSDDPRGPVARVSQTRGGTQPTARRESHITGASRAAGRIARRLCQLTPFTERISTMSSLACGVTGRATKPGPGLTGVAIIVGATSLVAALAGLITAPAVGGWYHELSKPTWTPPDWV